jgi:hypothetical protein
MADTEASVKMTPDPGAKPTGNMQASAPNGTYFRKGFGLKSEIQAELDSDYTGRLVDMLQAREYTLTAGDVTIRLAKEFGFCYGVERAVEYAYQARKKFPERTIYLAGEIIHNPHVNSKLQAMGITFLMPSEGRIDFSGVRPEDVVILPAFLNAHITSALLGIVVRFVSHVVRLVVFQPWLYRLYLWASLVEAREIVCLSATASPSSTPSKSRIVMSICVAVAVTVSAS